MRDLLDGRRPVLLVLAYARCTMLCSLVLRGVTEVARTLTPAPGADYQLVLVGLDPRETLDEATRKQTALLGELGRGDDARTLAVPRRRARRASTPSPMRSGFATRGILAPSSTRTPP